MQLSIRINATLEYVPNGHEQQPTPKTQLTQPKEGEPVEIPVPTEDDFEKLVRRAVKGTAATDQQRDST
jgi:hypothetical protein